MWKHIVRIVGILLLIFLCIVYPFFPGGYDRAAVALSAMAQVFGVVGLLLVPVGILWLVYELRRGPRSKQNTSYTDRSYYFTIASLVIGSIVALVVALFAVIGAALSLGLLTLILWVSVIRRLIPGLKPLKDAEAGGINPAPLYLIFLPVATLVFQVAVAAPMTEFSRNRAILNSAELIDEIENYRAIYRRYPASLPSVNKDYHPTVVGIEQYHYAPVGDAYNLFFEQPMFLLDNPGTQEFVVYNPLDEHFIPSHAYWLLTAEPERLMAQQGWYAAHDAAFPHWRYFWFD